MPDRRRHRGPHPDDHELFAEEQHPRLRQAVADLSWLLSGGYAQTSTSKLVGDRYRLTERQRVAVLRSACSDSARERRAAHRLADGELAGRPVDLDGFNILMTVESALAGGVLLVGRDGCIRDLASVHGSYRKVDESEPALALIGACLTGLGAGPCRWLFDRPVSNSGRIRGLTEELAATHGWPWSCELCDSPDPVLRASEQIVVTADSVILDACAQWYNLAQRVVRESVPGAWVVDMR